MKNEKYRLFNKTYQPILLQNGNKISPRGYLFVEEINIQILNLSKKGFINVKKV